MKTIVAAIDLSPVTAEVVAHAAGLARALRARVVLLTIMVEPVFVEGYAPPPALVRQVTVGHEKAVQHRLAEWQKRLARRRVPATCVVVQGGGTARRILEQARAAKATAIVIGSHGHTAFFDLLGGSTLQGVLKGATCPVVVIPARAARPRARR